MNMKTNSIVTFIGAAGIAFAFTACDSKQEEAREEVLEQKAENLEAGADQIRKDGETVADAKEEHADAIRNGSEKAADATEADADATRDAVEKRADQLESEADKVREAK
ncbi:MAG: hypothetical protein EOP85_04750 [Verrucomicrobiaceae bacterium]|nr:MAG: hypothetical protein EOP85_04750 [Verrucomicrobiaceae bacterium]